MSSAVFNTTCPQYYTCNLKFLSLPNFQSVKGCTMTLHAQGEDTPV